MTPSGEQFDPPWTDLGALLDAMLARCWPHAGPMLGPRGVLGHLGEFLQRSGAYLEATFDQNRTEDGKKTLDFREAIEYTLFFNGF